MCIWHMYVYIYFWYVGIYYENIREHILNDFAKHLIKYLLPL